MLEKALDKIKYQIRIAVLSMILLLVTTFISLIVIALPILFNPSRGWFYNIGSIIAGSIVGQVTLLVAMSLISTFLKRLALTEENSIEHQEISDDKE